jgi:hypothetical protein
MVMKRGLSYERGDNTLKLFENRVPRRTFDEAVRGGWRKSHNDEV